MAQAMSNPVGLLKDIWRLGQRAPEGRLVIADSGLDAFRVYVADSLNPSKLKSLLRAADSGDLKTTLSLFEEMQANDAHLHGVVNTRRKALTGLEWDILSAAESQQDEGDKTRADEIASEIKEQLRNLDSFEQALEHLSTAIGPNVAVLELVWQRNKLIDLLPIPSHRLLSDMQDPRIVRVITKDHPQGVVAQNPKFVVHVPDGGTGFPFSATACHATALIYLIKLLAVADWATYVELYGHPVRWANWPQNATAEQKSELLDMLKNMGSSAYAAFSPGTNLQFVESTQRGTSPHKDLVEWCAKQQSIAWLGQPMTTDTSGATGTFAAANVQNEVRQDLLEDDVRREARTLREQIIAPMVNFGFSDSKSITDRKPALPNFVRSFREEVDRLKEAQIFEVAQRIGLTIGADEAHERLGINQPQDDEERLVPSLDAFGESLTEDVGATV